MLPFSRIAIIGLGLIGSSIARAMKAHMPTVRVTGHDANEQVRETARRIALCDDITDTAGAAVTDADEGEDVAFELGIDFPVGHAAAVAKIVAIAVVAAAVAIAASAATAFELVLGKGDACCQQCGD